MSLIILYIILLKGMTIGFQTVLVVHAVQHVKNNLSAKLYVGLLLGYVGYSLIAFTSLSSELGRLLYIAVLLSSISPLFFWLLINSLYSDDFKVHNGYWLLLVFIAITASYGGVTKGIGVNTVASTENMVDIFLFYAPNILNLILLILSLRAILNNWRSDLVEARRWLWISVVPSIGIIMLIPLIVIVLSGSYLLPIWMEAMQATYVFLIFFVVVAWLLDSDPEHLLKNKARAWLDWFGWQSSESEPVEDLPAPKITIDNQGTKLKLDKIEQLMRDEKCFKRQKLTVNDLAQLLDMPEHQLRNLINRSLGFRNFNDFVNHYRIMHVVDALKNPETKRLPLMTLALDSGFNSIAPFNRAFKEKMGVAPNEYRTKLNDE